MSTITDAHDPSVGVGRRHLPSFAGEERHFGICGYTLALEASTGSSSTISSSSHSASGIG